MANNGAARLPWQWYLILFIASAIGLALVVWNPTPTTGLASLSKMMRAVQWARLLGIYVLSIVVSHLLIHHTMRGLHILFKLQGADTTADWWTPTILGVCESIMYPTALLADHADFIGLWLAMKVAGQWVRWSGEGAEASDDQKNEGRRRFNRFLVGNALSLILAYATFGALKLYAFVSPNR